jgi:5'-nucleotidase / UDP-sugar diphosphatase
MAGPRAALGVVLFTAAALAGCTQEGWEVDLSGQDVRLTLLHTSDWHSRLLPYELDVTTTDRNLGLNPALGPYGGVARLAYLIERERANAGRSVLVDSGDCFQGAPIFNVFLGEVEFRAMSQLRYDAVVIGNHEFDEGVDNLIQQARDWATFPLLASNYYYRRPPPGGTSLADVAPPYTIVNVDGLKIGFIGVANFSSLTSIGFADNSLGITPLDINQTVQHYINLLHPQVNLIVAVSHAGLGEDQEMIESTVGLDLVMGGHLHVVLDPPRQVYDASGRRVLLTHSGAFLKYLGRLDVVLRARPDDPNDFEVMSHQYQVFPIDRTVPEEASMLRLVEPYMHELRRQIDLTRVLGYAPQRIRRFGAGGGDSPVGNFVADGMRLRNRVETDFALTNSLGIRSDIVQGPITVDQMYNIFPFNNTITTMTLSGNEVREVLNFNAERSAARGCATQLPVAGVEFTMDCSVFPAVATDIRIGGEPILPHFYYTLATNNYIAAGGSGFHALRFNNTQQNTGIELRDAFIDGILAQPSCSARCESRREAIDECALLATCRTDMTRYFRGFCAGLDRHSAQDWCLDEHAPRCLELSERSDFDICREFADRGCARLYRESDREACYDAAAAEACEGVDPVSPRAKCAREGGAEWCTALALDSRFGDCVASARAQAESTCLELPCMEAESDGRIGRRLPTNEFVPTPDDPFEAGDIGAALMMERLQASPHNDEACY